jgi:hypothetical protein
MNTVRHKGLFHVYVMIVIFERGVSTNEMSFVGNLIVFVAVTAWGLYTVYAKRLIGKIGPIEATALTMLCGTIMFIPIEIVPALNFLHTRRLAVDKKVAERLHGGAISSAFWPLLVAWSLGERSADNPLIRPRIQTPPNLHDINNWSQPCVSKSSKGWRFLLKSIGIASSG